MTRGGKKHQKKNKNRIPIDASPRDTNRMPIDASERRDTGCCICFDEFNDDNTRISCSNKHSVCNICIKQLVMPCFPSLRGTCGCCGVSWKCPICRVKAGFPNAWSVMQFMLSDEERTKAIDRANIH